MIFTLNSKISSSSGIYSGWRVLLNVYFDEKYTLVLKWAGMGKTGTMKEAEVSSVLWGEKWGVWICESILTSNVCGEIETACFEE